LVISTYGLDDPRCGGESRVDLAGRDRHLTDVLVECAHFGEGRRRLEPGDLEPVGRLHRIPFVFGDDSDPPENQGRGVGRGFSI
jgi:hypothetical protein